MNQIMNTISKLRILLFMICLYPVNTFAQQTTVSKFQPAAAQKGHYDALYYLNSADDKKIKGIIRNIKNVLNDPRLRGRLHVELLAYGDGVEIYKKSGEYLPLLMPLKDAGVDLIQCANTMEERKISKSELFDFVDYVPSANGEIILRSYEGWAIIHP